MFGKELEPLQDNSDALANAGAIPGDRVYGQHQANIWAFVAAVNAYCKSVWRNVEDPACRKVGCFSSFGGLLLTFCRLFKFISIIKWLAQCTSFTIRCGVRFLSSCR